MACFSVESDAVAAGRAYVVANQSSRNSRRASEAAAAPAMTSAASLLA